MPKQNYHVCTISDGAGGLSWQEDKAVLGMVGIAVWGANLCSVNLSPPFFPKDGRALDDQHPVAGGL